VDLSPSITSADQTTFTDGSAGLFTVTSTGNPNAALSETGGLPTGVSFVDNGNGTATLGGTPTAGASGPYVLTISAANGVGSPATQSFTLTVDSPPAITSVAATSFTVGSAGSFTVATTGTPAPTVTESGRLPAGVSFTGGVLSGTPASGTTGVYPISFTAANGIGSPASQPFTLTVDSLATFTSASSTVFNEYSHGTFTATATGYPTPTIIEWGNLPHGVTFAGGVLSGAPTQNGTYPVLLTASNGVNPAATQIFTLTVNGLRVTTTSLPTLTKGFAYSQQLTATGGLAPLKWKHLGKLPKGVTLSTTGVLAASTLMTAATGSYSIEVQVTDATRPKPVQTATATLTLKIVF
jgi:hypothetical protein